MWKLFHRCRNPSFHLFLTDMIQQFTCLPLDVWIRLFQHGNTVGDGAASGRCERNHSLACQVCSFNECVYCSWCEVPPYRIAQKDEIILAHIHRNGFYFRPHLRIIHLYRTTRLFVCPVEVGTGIWLCRYYLADVGISKGRFFWFVEGWGALYIFIKW